MKTSFKLRQYQKEAADSATESSLKHLLLVLSTGMGKSYVIAELARRNLDKHILVFQPSKEILEQNVEKFVFATGKKPAILSASAKSWEVGNITFSTIGTAKGKIDELVEKGVDLIILDEAQEYPVDSKDSMITNLIKDLKYEGQVIGLTATPFVNRKGKPSRPMYSPQRHARYITVENHLDVLTTASNGIKKAFWEDIEYLTDPADSFDKGFLIKPNYCPLVIPDQQKLLKLLKVGSGGENYTKKSLQEFDTRMYLVYLSTAKALAEKHKRLIIFVETIEIAEKLANEIENGYCISSLTKKKERTAILEEFRGNKRDKMVIFNVSVLGRGFDSPNCEAIAFFSPTKSLIRYMQFVGRCLRPDPENLNKQAYVYDFNHTMKNFGRIENIRLQKDMFGDWQIYGILDKRKGPEKLSGNKGRTTVWLKSKWEKEQDKL